MVSCHSCTGKTRITPIGFRKPQCSAAQYSTCVCTVPDKSMGMGFWKKKTTIEYSTSTRRYRCCWMCTVYTYTVYLYMTIIRLSINPNRERNWGRIRFWKYNNVNIYMYTIIITTRAVRRPKKHDIIRITIYNKFYMKKQTEISVSRQRRWLLRRYLYYAVFK